MTHDIEIKATWLKGPVSYAHCSCGWDGHVFAQEGREHQQKQASLRYVLTTPRS